MSNKISLAEYAPVISLEDKGKEIYNLIKLSLDANDTIDIDMSGIKTMATICAKQIFGTLYNELGSESFYSRIAISNASPNVKATIRTGIIYSLQ